MNSKTKRLIMYLVVFNYCYWQFIYPFLKFFRFEKTFNEIFWLKSFESLHKSKTAFGTSHSSLKNKDKFGLKGDPLYNLLKVRYLFPINKAKTVLPWTDKNKKFLDFYYKTAEQRWSTVRDRTRRGFKPWIKKWDPWDYWLPKVRKRKNTVFKKSPKPKKKKLSIYDLVARDLTLSDRYNSKQLELDINKPKLKRLAKRFKKLKKRRNKYKWSGNLDFLARKNGVQMQLEHITRNRRLTERVVDRGYHLEFFPTNSKHPMNTRTSLSNYPYKKTLSRQGPMRANMGLRSWNRRGTRGTVYQLQNESKVMNPLIKRQRKKYKKFLKRRKWYITLNEHIKNYALSKTLEKKKKILEKILKKKKKNLRWRKAVKKWEKSKRNELFHPLAYKNAKKRAKFFEKFLKKIIYCKTQKEMGWFTTIKRKTIKRLPLQFDLWQVDEVEEHLFELECAPHTVKTAWKLFDEMYDVLDAETEDIRSVKQDRLDEQRFEMNKFRALLKAVRQNYYADRFTLNHFADIISNSPELEYYPGEWDRWDANNDDDDWFLDYMNKRYWKKCEYLECVVKPSDFSDLLSGREPRDFFPYEESEMGYWDLPEIGRNKPIIMDIENVAKRFLDPKRPKCRLGKVKDYSWWGKAPILHYMTGGKKGFKWTDKRFNPKLVNPSVLKIFYNRYNLMEKKKKTPFEALKAPKLGGKFVNKNFIQFKQEKKTHAIREAKFFEKFLKAKYERNKNYQNRVKKWRLPPKYSNIGKSLDTKATNFLGEGYSKKIVNALSKLIFNKFNLYLWQFQIIDRFWHILEALFGIDTKHTIIFSVTKNKLIANYWSWWIKVSLKLLSSNQKVMGYWYKESEEHSINFSDKYLNYIRGKKKISFNEINFDNFNVIVIKFIAKIFILAISFLSFAYNLLFFWLENTILINISKFFEFLSYFSS